MHEFAITRSLLQQIEIERKKLGATVVKQVNLLVGEKSAVVPECVQFYFDQLKTGTPAASAKLTFRRVPLRIRCRKCGKEFATVEEMCDCNAGGEITGGDELLIESIEVE